MWFQRLQREAKSLKGKTRRLCHLASRHMRHTGRTVQTEEVTKVHEMVRAHSRRDTDKIDAFLQRHVVELLRRQSSFWHWENRTVVLVWRGVNLSIMGRLRTCIEHNRQEYSDARNAPNICVAFIIGESVNDMEKLQALLFSLQVLFFNFLWVEQCSSADNITSWGILIRKIWLELCILVGTVVAPSWNLSWWNRCFVCKKHCCPVQL